VRRLPHGQLPCLPKPTTGGTLGSNLLDALSRDPTWFLQTKWNGWRAFAMPDGRVYDRSGRQVHQVLYPVRNQEGHTIDGEYLPLSGEFKPFDVIVYGMPFLQRRMLLKYITGEDSEVTMYDGIMGVRLNLEVEGIVAKREASLYPASAVTTDWFKFKGFP
jgi:ATP-dependent DNA ligase